MSDMAEQTEVKGFDAYTVTLGDLMRGERATLGKSLLDVQRDLRIKAAYISAIENSDPSAFSTPGFIAGYVRSYARYLGLDPEATFQKFCDEAGYNGVHPRIGPKARPRRTAAGAGLSAPSITAMKPARDTAPKKAAADRPAMRKAAGKTTQTNVAQTMATGIANAGAGQVGLFPPQARFLPTSDSFFTRISPSAIGSVLMLVVLILGLGYGAWAMLQDIQRVDFVPVDAAPPAIADAGPVGDPALPVAGMSGGKADASTLARTAALDRLYRPKELDVPVMTPRDGPIAALDPNRIGALVANNGTVQAEKTAKLLATTAPRVTEIAPPQVAVVASRPAWVRITKADGTVLFEKILDGGESFVLPAGSTAATLRAGNSGAVYLTLDNHPYGPVGNGTSVAKDVVLSARDIVGKYAEVSDQTALAALDSPRVITLNNVPAGQ